VIGAVSLSAAVLGYIKRPLGVLERIAALAAALLLIKPGWITDLIGIALVVIVMLLQRKKDSLARSETN
jgi:TRAP-type uncharacterized transport system fused permease subunit